MTTQVASLEAVFTANTTNFERGAQRVENSMGNLGTRISGAMGNVGSSITGVGTAIAGLAGPVAAGFGGAAMAAISFESAFAGVIKTVDATDTELAAIRQTIRDMATDASNPLSGIENAHETLAGIMEVAGQLGVATDDLVGFTQVMGEMGLATNVTAEEAATLTARFANVTGMSFDNVRNFGSAIVDLGNNSATTEAEILSMASRIAAAGSQAGMAEADILGVSAALSSAGISAELGGTNFSRFISDIAVAVATGGEDLQGFANVAGMTADEFAATWGTDATAAVTSFITGLGNMDQAAQLTTLQSLGLTGTELTRVITSLSGNTDLLTDSLNTANTAWTENTALANEANQRLQTTESQMNVAKNTVRDLAIEIGAALLPALNDMLQGILPVVQSVTDWAAENPRVVQTLAAVATVLTVVGGVLIPLGMAISAAGTIFGALASAAGLVMAGLSALAPVLGVIGAAIGVLLSPIGLVVAAVVALGVAFATNFGGIRDTAIEVFENVIRPAVEGFIALLGSIWESVQPGLSSFRDGISGIFSWIDENVVQPFIGLIEGLPQTISNVVSGLGQTLSGLGVMVVDAINNAIPNEVSIDLGPLGNVGIDIADNPIPGGSGGSGGGTLSGSLVNQFAGGGFQVPQRARGGPVTAGMAYEVGEEGRELFIPESSGNVVSNDQLGGVQIQSITINANDAAGGRAAAESFAARLNELMRSKG